MSNENKAAPRFPGEMVQIGDRSFVVPPLSFKQLRALSADIKSIGTNFNPLTMAPEDVEARFSALTKIIHTALSRNYPDLPLAELEDMLDLGNIQPSIEAVMAISGYAKTKSSGGAQAETPLTGTPST